MKSWTINTIVDAWIRLKKYIPRVRNIEQKMILEELIERIDYVQSQITWVSNHRDDDAKDMFVTFWTPEASYAAHTLLLLFGTKKVKSGNKNVEPYQWRYLPALLAKDYTWVAGILKTAWYATEESYHEYLVKGIEKWWLAELDKNVDMDRRRLIHDALMWYFAWLW